MHQALEEIRDETASASALGDVTQPGIGRVLSARSPVCLNDAYGDVSVARPCCPAPGQHTDEVLTDVLGLSAAELGRLRDQGVIGKGS